MTLTLGPLVLPASALALLVGILLAIVLAAWLRRRSGVDVDRWVHPLLLLALVAARLAAVVRGWADYRELPWWAVFDLRDGGFDPLFGLAALLPAAALLAWRHAAERRALILVLAVGVAGWALSWIALPLLFPPPQASLGQLTLHDLQGRSVALAPAQGRPTVIYVWAGWCPACRRQTPVMLRAQQALPQAQWIFVNQAEAPEVVARLLQQMPQAPQQALLDRDGGFSRQLEITALPSILIFDGDGALRQRHVGAWSQAALRQALRPLWVPCAGAAPADAAAHCP